MTQEERGPENEQATIGVVIVRNETPLFTDVLATALATEPSIHLLSPPLTEDAAAASVPGIGPTSS